MDLTTERVWHIQFGSGVILTQTASIVEVRFDEKYGTKKFLYPSSFESFLVLSDPVHKQAMDDKLKQLREKSNEDHRIKMEAKKALEEEQRASVKKTTRAKTVKPKAAKPAKPKSKKVASSS